MKRSTTPPPALAEHAVVEKRHRLAVLQAQGYTEAWLAERSSHVATRWLEQGGFSPVIGNADKLAQAIADAEANGRRDREGYARGLRQILDRIDRAIAAEVGEERLPPLQLGELHFCKGLVGAINDVYSFHDVTETPCLDSPQWPGDERAQLRMELIFEEFGEVMSSLGCRLDGDGAWNKEVRFDGEPRTQLALIADGLVDLIYVCVGTALEFGIPLDRAWNEVQRANMAKVGPDGKVLRREDGKILKPEGWQPPDIEKAVFGARSHTCEELEAMKSEGKP